MHASARARAHTHTHTEYLSHWCSITHYVGLWLVFLTMFLLYHLLQLVLIPLVNGVYRQRYNPQTFATYNTANLLRGLCCQHTCSFFQPCPPVRDHVRTYICLLLNNNLVWRRHRVQTLDRHLYKTRCIMIVINISLYTILLHQWTYQLILSD